MKGTKHISEKTELCGFGVTAEEREAIVSVWSLSHM